MSRVHTVRREQSPRGPPWAESTQCVALLSCSLLTGQIQKLDKGPHVNCFVNGGLTNLIAHSYLRLTIRDPSACHKMPRSQLPKCPSHAGCPALCSHFPFPSTNKYQSLTVFLQWSFFFSDQNHLCPAMFPALSWQVPQWLLSQPVCRWVYRAQREWLSGKTLGVGELGWGALRLSPVTDCDRSLLVGHIVNKCCPGRQQQHCNRWRELCL